jgi:hypothetical protein
VTGAADGHTPGPWRLEPRDGLPHVRVTAHGGCSNVATVYGLSLADADAERDANADLIARAPTLLADNARLAARERVLREALSGLLQRAMVLAEPGPQPFTLGDSPEYLAARAALAEGGAR